MDDKWRSEWSRHYDQIQWTAITLLTAAVGGLVAYSYNRFDPLVAFLGVWLTWLTVWYTASFREFRRQLHNGMKSCDEKRFLKNREKSKRIFHQWPAFVLTFSLLTILLLWKYWDCGYRNQAICLGIISFLIYFLTYWRVR